uniref:Solute carrier family 28 member 3 n=1 Tax=Equus caballus TaxID=9796 RepID=A0A9L0TGX7_HORSE
GRGHLSSLLSPSSWTTPIFLSEPNKTKIIYFRENQNTSGNDSSLRSRAVQSRGHGKAKQDEEQVTIELDSTRNKEDEKDDQEMHPKGYLERKYGMIQDFYHKHKTTFRYIFWVILLAAYLAMVIAACAFNFHRALPLFMITVALLSPGRRFLDSHWSWLKWVIWSSLILGAIFWLIFDTAKLGQRQLVSFGGLIMYVILMFLFSKHPTKVSIKLMPVFWGIGLQFLLGLLILRTVLGLMAFQWLGKQVQTFLEHTDAGASFVFGEKYTDHFFAFKVLPIMVFFSAAMSMLYYLGLMQWIIRKVGWLMLVTVGSSPIESVVAAGGIFIGQTESPLLVRPYLPHVTRSELHAIMTAGFSTIAGSVLGAYISFGISPTHILTASVMSAPASLAMAKLLWPETETPKITLKNAMEMEMGDSRNLLETASQGASASISLVANIAVNQIAFLAPLSFVNPALSWFGNMFDYSQLSFEIRSETIAAYALCGFTNFGSLGIVIGGLTSMAPSRKRDIASGAVRALIAGTVACFMTACIAGILSSTPVDITCHHILENTFASSLSQNTTDVASCCQSLLSRYCICYNLFISIINLKIRPKELFYLFLNFITHTLFKYKNACGNSNRLSF